MTDTLDPVASAHLALAEAMRNSEEKQRIRAEHRARQEAEANRLAEEAAEKERKEQARRDREQAAIRKREDENARIIREAEDAERQAAAAVVAAKQAELYASEPMKTLLDRAKESHQIAPPREDVIGRAIVKLAQITGVEWPRELWSLENPNLAVTELFGERLSASRDAYDDIALTVQVIRTDQHGSGGDYAVARRRIETIADIGQVLADYPGAFEEAS